MVMMEDVKDVCGGGVGRGGDVGGFKEEEEDVIVVIGWGEEGRDDDVAGHVEED